MNTWLVPTPSEDPETGGTLFKLSTANPLLIFDFGNFDELEPDDATLAGTPTVESDAAGLTIGTPALLGAYRVRVQVSGGSAGQTYVLSCTAVTSDGVTLTGRGTLVVK